MFHTSATIYNKLEIAPVHWGRARS